MARGILRCGVFSSVLVLTLAVLASRAQAQEEKARLARKIDFPGWNDPKITLREALAYLGAKYDWKIEADIRAFKAQGIEDVLTSPVAEKPLPKQAKVTVGILLQQVLNRLPSPATYTIQRDRLLVVPISEPVLREIAREYQSSPLRARLARRITLGREFEANAKLKDVLAFLRDKHGLPVVILPNAEELEVKLARQTSVSIEAVLKQLAGQIGGACVLRHDHVLLVPIRNEPPVP
jgi:hypothetical protein